MNKLLKIPLCIIIAMGVIFFTEQILYRFHEGYAKLRADWLWSLAENNSLPQWLQHIPVDQFQTIPAPDDFPEIDELLEVETKFTRAVLGHTRAGRDLIYNELLSKTIPADKPLCDTRVFGNTENERQHNIQVPLKSKDLEGTILWILKPRQDYTKEKLDAVKKKLEKQFTPLLRKSFACGIVHGDIAGAVKALKKDKELNKEYPHLTRRIFAWVDSDVSNLFANQVAEEFDLIVFNQPEKLPRLATVSDRSPCVLFFTDENTAEPVQEDARNWIKQLRGETSKLGIHRLSALLHHGKVPAHDSANARLALGYAYMIEVNRVMGSPAKPETQPAKLDATSTHSSSEAEEQSSLLLVTQGDPLSPGPIPVVDPPFPSPSNPKVFLAEDDFDCETLRIYRTQGNNLEWRNYPNRKLILTLGRLFEQSNALPRIKEQDPDFVMFYDSLKWIHAPSP